MPHLTCGPAIPRTKRLFNDAIAKINFPEGLPRMPRIKRGGITRGILENIFIAIFLISLSFLIWQMS